MSRRRLASAVVLLAAAGLAACSPAPSQRASTITGPQPIPGLENPSTSPSPAAAGPASSAIAPSSAAVATSAPAGPIGPATAPAAGQPVAPAPVGATGRASAHPTSTHPTAGTHTSSAPVRPAIAHPLYTGAADTRGITATSINLCAHAALTYGAAFNTNASDFNVHWDAVKDAGGIYGRNVNETYQNDNYDPDTAVQAATACKDSNPFLILGGIGFDQIPKVREWAEQNKELYLYHDATINGEAGKKYSFTFLPTVEQLGAEFAILAHSRFQTKRIGVIYRDSAEWDPGYDAFLQLAQQYGLQVVVKDPVQKNAGNYTQQILDMKNAHVDVVFVWENALAATAIVKQAKAQVYSPNWLLFPFNLTSQTLGDDALTPKMLGIATWPAYSKGDYSGGFAPYASDMKQFEAEYAKYDPNVDLSGVGGDLLFLNWVGQKALEHVLRDCGPNCTRSSFANMLSSGYHYTDPSGCGIDFRPGDHHLGGNQVSLFETYKAPDGKVNWHPLELCVNQVH